VNPNPKKKLFVHFGFVFTFHTHAPLPHPLSSSMSSEARKVRVEMSKEARKRIREEARTKEEKEREERWKKLRKKEKEESKKNREKFLEKMKVFEESVRTDPLFSEINQSFDIFHRYSHDNTLSKKAPGANLFMKNARFFTQKDFRDIFLLSKRYPNVVIHTSCRKGWTNMSIKGKYLCLPPAEDMPYIAGFSISQNAIVYSIIAGTKEGPILQRIRRWLKFPVYQPIFLSIEYPQKEAKGDPSPLIGPSLPRITCLI
jgi:hypothetical protein